MTEDPLAELLPPTAPGQAPSEERVAQALEQVHRRRRARAVGVGGSVVLALVVALAAPLLGTNRRSDQVTISAGQPGGTASRAAAGPPACGPAGRRAATAVPTAAVTVTVPVPSPTGPHATRVAAPGAPPSPNAAKARLGTPGTRKPPPSAVAGVRAQKARASEVASVMVRFGRQLRDPAIVKRGATTSGRTFVFTSAPPPGPVTVLRVPPSGQNTRRQPASPSAAPQAGPPRRASSSRSAAPSCSPTFTPEATHPR
jgi:hypothetical protein